MVSASLLTVSPARSPSPRAASNASSLSGGTPTSVTPPRGEPASKAHSNHYSDHIETYKTLLKPRLVFGDVNTIHLNFAMDSSIGCASFIVVNVLSCLPRVIAICLLKAYIAARHQYHQLIKFIVSFCSLAQDGL